MGRRIGIMGGTFNPVHNGHIMIAESAANEFDLDEVMFIPNGNAYMKKNVLDTDFRVEMVRLAIEDKPAFSLSTIETEREGASYSYETINCLKEAFPDDDFFFIVGADSLLNMENWRSPELIFTRVTVLACIRPGSDSVDFHKKAEYLKNKYTCDIDMITTCNIDISSTDIRNRVKSGMSIDGLVPEKVKEFILRNGLYNA